MGLIDHACGGHRCPGCRRYWSHGDETSCRVGRSWACPDCARKKNAALVGRLVLEGRFWTAVIR